MKKNIILNLLTVSTLCILATTLPKLSKVENRTIQAIPLTFTQINMSWTYVSGTDPNTPSTDDEFVPLRSKFLGIDKKEITYPNIPETKQSWTYINSEDSNSPSTDDEFTPLRSKFLGIDKKEITYPNVPESKQSWTYINSDGSNSPSTKEDFELLRNTFLKK